MFAVSIPGDSHATRLTPDEVDQFFLFAVQMHDHDATAPAQPIFWYRTQSIEFSRFYN